MIIKEVDSVTSKDKFLQAGFRAEKKLAHYLSRAFKEAKDILVLNGIRLESDDDSAQIDHLIIHKYGMVIIENKSAVGTIRINERGEWLRLDYNLGMASPVLQGERQAAFLKRYLNQSGLEPPHDPFKSLVRKITFDHVPVDVLVAISDTGIFDPHPTVNTDNVHKADVIPGKIRTMIAEYRRLSNPFSLTLTATPLKLSPELMDDIANLLKARHVPRAARVAQQIGEQKAVYHPPASGTRRRTEKSHTSSRKTPVPAGQHKGKGFVPASNRPGFRCEACGGEMVSIRWGRYGYHFTCSACPNRMAAHGYCKECGRKSKLSKDRNRFYVKCEEHGKGALFFTNPS